MRTIERTVDILAPARTVWGALVDFRRYPEWNAFVTSVEGDPVVGARLRVQLRPPGGRGMVFRPKVLVADPGRELRWIGRLLVPGLFDGEHRFVIEETGRDRCRLTQGETFRGVLVALLGHGLERTADGFEAMNHALKARAEELVRSDQST